FCDGAAAIDPAVRGGRFDHGVFTGDLVGRHGYRAHGCDVGEDVQVAHGRLDHHHVSAFFEVEFHLDDGFPAVGGIHLVGPAVTLELRVHGFAEGAVES